MTRVVNKARGVHAEARRSVAEPPGVYRWCTRSGFSPPGAAGTIYSGLHVRPRVWLVRDRLRSRACKALLYLNKYHFVGFKSRYGTGGTYRTG